MISSESIYHANVNFQLNIFFPFLPARLLEELEIF